MKLTKIITLSAVVASSLFAIDTVSNLGANAPHNSSSATNDTSIVFTWTPPANDVKYYWLLDTNATNTYADSYTTANWQTKTLVGDELTASTITHSLPTVSASGTYYYHIVAVDGSDNTSSTVTSTAMNIDITKGTVTMSPDGGSLSAVASLTMTGSETGTIYYTTDSSTPTTSSSVYSSPLSIMTGKTVKAFLVDSAGNSGDVVTKVFTSSVQPTVKTTQNATSVDGTTFATSSTNIIASVTPNTSLTIGGGSSAEGFTRYKYKKSTDNDYVTVSSIATTIDISTLSSGSYTYYVLGGDAYNYKDVTDKKSVTFTVDNDVPTSLKISYDNNSTVTRVNPDLASQAGVITLSATGSSEIKYDYSSEPSTYASYSNTYSSTFTLDTSSVSTGTEGIVRLYMAARDSSGNWAKTSKTFTVDKKKPTLTMPSAKSFSSSFTTTIGFDDDSNTSTSMSDENGSIKYLVQALTGSTCSTSVALSSLSNTYSSSVTIGPATASQCLYAAAIDRVGNSSSVSSTLFTYSSTAIQLDVNLSDNKTFATVSTYGATPMTDINVTLSETGTSHFGYTFDNNGTETNSTAKSELISLTALSEGDHNISVVGYKTDLTDANVTQTRSFTIDNTPPTAFSSSDYNDTNFTTTSYTLTLTKPSNAAYIMYSEDNSTFTSSSASSVDVVISATKTIYTKTKDTAGNMSAVYSATLTQNIPVQSVSLSAGWNMTVLPTGTIATASLSNPIVWDYNGSTWGNNQNDSYTQISATSINKGYWVYLSSSTSMNIDGQDTSSSTNISGAASGWSFLGTTSAISSADLNSSSAQLTWIYDSGIWKYNTKISGLSATLSHLGYTEIESIPADSGYWIYK